uniref:Uncharacterized protein n=1 Tax=Panagrolaimus sp. ES5 TaxID=591445 RepID=A0AC34F1F9_9BILA
MDDNEAESLNLNNENQEKRSPQEIFAEILKSLDEYTDQKTHRPLKIGNYFFGLSEYLIKDRTLIIFEWEDKRMVRQYYKHWGNNQWRCLGCERRYRRQLKASRFHVYFVNGIVFIPFGHDCNPRDREIVMQYQKFLQEGNVQLARRMSQLVNFDYGESSLANVINKLNLPSSSMPKQSYSKERENVAKKPSANLKRKLNDIDCTSSSADMLPLVKKKSNDTCCIDNKMDLSNNQKHENTVMKKEKEATPIPATTFSFKKPFNFTLKNICNKLDIKFCKEALNFWEEIKFKKMNTLSTNIKTQKFKTKNFHKILSNFFTGRFCDYPQIYFAINEALRNKLVDKGEMTANEIDELCSSYKVTETHFKFIAEFIPCKILIFDLENNEVKKYGKWKNENNNNILSLVLAFENRKYSVVVDL